MDKDGEKKREYIIAQTLREIIVVSLGTYELAIHQCVILSNALF